MRFLGGILGAIAIGGALLISAGPSSASSGDVVNTGGAPLGVVIDSGGTAYIGDLSGGGVRVLPTGATEASQILKTSLLVGGIAIAGDGTLYVEGWDPVKRQEEIGVIPKGAAGVERTIAETLGSHLIAAAPDGTLYVPNYDAGTISVIPAGADAPSQVIQVGAGPREVAVAQDGTVYVTNQVGGTVSVIPPGASTSRTVQVSSAAGETDNPHGIAVGPDGTVYVADITANDVAVIKPGGSTPSYRVPVPGGPKEVAVASDGTAYVLSSADHLSVIPPGATAVTSSLPTAHNPGHIAVRANGSVLITVPESHSVAVFPRNALSSPPTAPPSQAPINTATPSSPSAAAQSTSAPQPLGRPKSAASSGGSWVSLPAIFGVVVSALLLGALATVVVGMRRRRQGMRPDSTWQHGDEPRDQTETPEDSRAREW